MIKEGKKGTKIATSRSYLFVSHPFSNIQAVIEKRQEWSEISLQWSWGVRKDYEDFRSTFKEFYIFPKIKRRLFKCFKPCGNTIRPAFEMPC